MDSIYTQLVPHINDESMPFQFVPKIQALGVNGFNIKDFGGPGLTNLEIGSIVYEMARKDGSIATFVLVSNLGSQVVDSLGDQEQRKRILSETINMNKYICFGLTEANNGSDATSLKTTATKVEGGYLLNGNKRWIGQGTFAEYIVVWARNEADGNRI